MSDQYPPQRGQPPQPGPPQWQQPLPTYWPPPRPPMTAGRMARIMLGGLVGGVVGYIVPFLPGFFWAVLTGQGLGIPGLLYGLMLLITVPCGVTLGALWARQKTRP